MMIDLDDDEKLFITAPFRNSRNHSTQVTPAVLRGCPPQSQKLREFDHALFKPTVSSNTTPPLWDATAPSRSEHLLFPDRTQVPQERNPIASSTQSMALQLASASWWLLQGGYSPWSAFNAFHSRRRVC